MVLWTSGGRVSGSGCARGGSAATAGVGGRPGHPLDRGPVRKHHDDRARGAALARCRARPVARSSNRPDTRRDIMRKLGLAVALVVAATLVASTPAMAQAAKKKARQRLSPHETITATIDGDELKLVYGR